MAKIIIEASTSYLAADAVMSLLKGGFVASTARISYNLNKGLPPTEATDEYPLILTGMFGVSPVRIYVTSVTAGYGGEGPHTMVDILKVAGFKFKESDILTDKLADSTKQINLLYMR